MEQENKNSSGIILSLSAFFSSIVSIFTMYYLFAAVALITGILGLKNKSTRGFSIVAIIVVAVSFIIKMVNIVMTEGMLPEWFMKGMM